MKIFKTLYLGLAAAIGVGMFASCQDDMDTPNLVIPEATLQANTTIAELKDAMWKTDTNYATLCPEKDAETHEHYIIKGRVISSDASGNIYKAMYIQDETAAITLSINRNSLYTIYRLGQEVVLDVTGLYIGKYAGLEQIGGYGEYNGTPQVSFASYPAFEEHVQLNGLPSEDCATITYGSARPADSMYCTVMTIEDVNNATTDAEVRALQSQLVELRNVHFEDAGNNTFSSYQATESRNLMDEKGNTIVVRTSGYSNFYSRTLPEGIGSVRGMLSYFNGTWQLILRSYGDVLFGDHGQQSDPYTVDEALALMDMGSTGWVKGYIVGAVKGGVTEVKNNSDIFWGADVDMDNNVVIAPTADTKDWTKCLLVELPSGSDMRKVVNLLENGGNLGKELNVRGTFATQLGMGAVTGNNGTTSEFEMEGSVVTPPDQPTVEGVGSLFENWNKGGDLATYTGWSNVVTKGNMNGWFTKEFNSNYYISTNAYKGTETGGPYEQWLISPAIDLNKSTAKTLTFTSQAAYQASDCTYEVYVMTSNNPATATITKLNATFATPPASGYSSWVNSGTVDLSAFSGVVYIGWRYYSAKGGNNNSTTICIDDINIGGAAQ